MPAKPHPALIPPSSHIREPRTFNLKGPGGDGHDSQTPSPAPTFILNFKIFGRTVRHAGS